MCLGIQVFKLLKPHMRNTLNMNMQGRMGLSHAGNKKYELKLECIFTAGKFIMPMACALYRDYWFFDLQHLEKDLIHR